MGRIGRSGISVRSRIGGYSKRRSEIGERHEARKRGQKNIDCDRYAIPEAVHFVR